MAKLSSSDPDSQSSPLQILKAKLSSSDPMAKLLLFKSW
jgi:hypothetical protein